MRNSFKIAIVVAAVLALAAVVPQAQASCGAPYQINTQDSNGKISFIWNANFIFEGWYYGTPYTYSGTPPVSPAFDAVFWSYGVGGSNNNGAFTVDQWNTSPLTPRYNYPSIGFFSGGEIFTTWAANGQIAGCLFNGGTVAGALDGDECTCVLMTDVGTDAQGSPTGFYAALGNGIDANGNTFFTQPGDDGAGNGTPIVMNAIPKPTIVGSFRDPGTNDITLDVNVPAGGSDYLGTTGAACNCGATGYKVLAQVLPRGSAPPTDRSSGTGWTALALAGGAPQEINPVGTPVTVQSLCGATDTDVYLATQLFFDSGFSTSVVSSNSTKVECGPNVADPQPIRPRFDKPRQELRRNERGARR